jgi:hypothetical protein
MLAEAPSMLTLMLLLPLSSSDGCSVLRYCFHVDKEEVPHPSISCTMEKVSEEPSQFGVLLRHPPIILLRLPTNAFFNRSLSAQYEPHLSLNN